MNLTPDQYGKMCREFPGVEAYILRCELCNELDYLERNEMILTDWQKDRLKFLREFRSETHSF